jgi:hypothetical protein
MHGMGVPQRCPASVPAPAGFVGYSRAAVRLPTHRHHQKCVLIRGSPAVSSCHYISQCKRFSRASNQVKEGILTTILYSLIHCCVHHAFMHLISKLASNYSFDYWRCSSTASPHASRVSVEIIPRRAAVLLSLVPAAAW